MKDKSHGKPEYGILVDATGTVSIVTYGGFGSDNFVKVAMDTIETATSVSKGIDLDLWLDNPDYEPAVGKAIGHDGGRLWGPYSGVALIQICSWLARTEGATSPVTEGRDRRVYGVDMLGAWMDDVASLNEGQKSAPALAFSDEERQTRKGAFKISSRWANAWKKKAGKDLDQMLFKKYLKVIDSIPRSKLPVLFGKKNMADAQDVLAKNARTAFKLFLRKVFKVSPKLHTLLIKNSDMASIVFYVIATRVSGKDMADIFMKMYFKTDIKHDGAKKEHVEAVSDISEKLNTDVLMLGLAADHAIGKIVDLVTDKMVSAGDAIEGLDDIIGTIKDAKRMIKRKSRK